MRSVELSERSGLVQRFEWLAAIRSAAPAPDHRIRNSPASTRSRVSNAWLICDFSAR